MGTGSHKYSLNSGSQKRSAQSQEAGNQPLQPSWLQGVVSFFYFKKYKVTVELYRCLQMHIPMQIHIVRLLLHEIHTVLLPR